jgi:transposase
VTRLARRARRDAHTRPRGGVTERPIVAGFILGHVGDPARFPTSERFASYNGTAPIEASRGPRKRTGSTPEVTAS